MHIYVVMYVLDEKQVVGDVLLHKVKYYWWS